MGEDVEFDHLLFFEFPNHGSVSGKRFQFTKLGRVHFATFFTFYVPGRRAEFYVVHSPENGFAYEVAEFVAGNYEKLRKDQGSPESKADRRIPEKIRKQLGIPNEMRTHYIGEKVPFTGEIIIYHEQPLSKAQKGELYDLYVKRDVVVQFRGPKHIAKMWADHGPPPD